MRLFFCKEIIMRKLALLAGTALLMAGPAFAAGPGGTSIPIPNGHQLTLPGSEGGQVFTPPTISFPGSNGGVTPPPSSTISFPGSNGGEVFTPPTTPAAATVPVGSASLGGGVANVSGGGAGNETSFSDTQSGTSVENGTLTSNTVGNDTSYTAPTVGDGGNTPSVTDTTTTTTNQSATFSNTSQSAEAAGGESGGGSYSGTAVEGGISESGTFPANGLFNGY
jgi:hypothetical protein